MLLYYAAPSLLPHLIVDLIFSVEFSSVSLIWITCCCEVDTIVESNSSKI